MSASLALFLFTTDAALACEAVDAGVFAIVIDWENVGKRKRQAGFDTQVNGDTLADLERMRGATSAHIACRINGPGIYGVAEVEAAIAGGADELLLPMVRKPEDVARLLDVVRGRCSVGILVETVSAVRHAESLARLPLSRVYVGLNDLAIERDSRSLFAAVADGTVEHLRSVFRGTFGFGGLTLPERGSPVPCRLLMGEMVRLGCQFTFLRRSFLRDCREVGVARTVRSIQAACQQAGARVAADVERDRGELHVALREVALGPA